MKLLERRRALIMAQSKQDDIVLPSDYIKLNYIESTGTQWIDTTYVCKDDYTPYRVKCKFRMTDINSNQGFRYVFGTNRNNVGVEYVLSFAGSLAEKKFTIGRLSSTGAGVRFADLDTELHEIEYIFQEGAYFDKVFIEGFEQQASVLDAYSTRNMGLFTRINGTTVSESQMSKCQIYRFEMYGQDENNMILVPAQRKSDGVIGMYDIVTNTFLTNSGTGEFIGG